MTTLIEIHYLPTLAYFCAIDNAHEILLERHENFTKQSYRNRTYINTTQGKAALIIPLTNKHGKTNITDIRIDYNQKWLNNHWRTIVSAYKNSPFFEYYADDLEAQLFKNHKFLYDLNVQSLSMCLKWLQWDTTIKETLSYTKQPEATIQDYRSIITPKKEHYLEKIYQAVPYNQVFGNSFVENLSLIDLIFCSGPEASRIIRLSSRRE